MSAFSSQLNTSCRLRNKERCADDKTFRAGLKEDRRSKEQRLRKVFPQPQPGDGRKRRNPGQRLNRVITAAPGNARGPCAGSEQHSELGERQRAVLTADTPPLLPEQRHTCRRKPGSYFARCKQNGNCRSINVITFLQEGPIMWGSE